MEKPSLEIGNGNWAIKENNLLGYANVDGMILPDPVTVTRASLATRVNPSGLIEDVALVLGDEILDGGFDIDGNWTKQTGWSIANGVANSVASGNGQDLIRSVSGEITSGKTYKIEYTISNHVTGGVKTFLSGGGAVQGVTNSGNGTYVDYLLAPANNTSFKITTASGGFTGSIENVSLKEATINGLAKIDYTDGTANLLVEPARTNLVTYSEDFGNAFWNFNTEISKDLNSIAAPDSTSTADKIKGTTASSRHYIGRSALANASESASFSVFAKAGELRYLQIASFNTVNQHANFDLLTGTIGNIGSDFANVTMQSLVNGWYRITLTSVDKYNGFYLFLVSGLTASWAETWSMSNDTDGLYLWGAQVEEAAYSTSYIKTSGTTVTRAQDVITKTGISDKINSTEGVLFFETAFLNDTGNYKSVTLSDGTTANRITFENRPVANQIKVFVCVSGTNVMQSTQTLTDVKAFNKIAIKWKQNDFAWWVNGVKIYTDTSGNTFSANTLNRLGFDRGDGFTLLEGKVKQLQVYKTALTDLEIESLTSFASFTEMTNALNYTIY